jgi:hypothetical protein
MNKFFEIKDIASVAGSYTQKRQSKYQEIYFEDQTKMFLLLV